jgi:hypothetical protein
MLGIMTSAASGSAQKRCRFRNFVVLAGIVSVLNQIPSRWNRKLASPEEFWPDSDAG